MVRAFLFLGRHASMGFSCKLQNNAAIELLIPEHQNGHYARSPEMDFWLAQLVVCRKTGMRPARKLLSLNHLIKTDMFDILHNICYTMIVLLSKGGFMQKVNIRDLLHNFSRYLKDVKRATVLRSSKGIKRLPILCLIILMYGIRDGSELLKNGLFPGIFF